MTKIILSLFNIFSLIVCLTAQTSERKVANTADKMPILAVCEGTKSPDICTKERINDYIIENMDYPIEAINQNIEGIVIVSFVIRWDGSIVDIKLENDIGGGCGAEAMRLIDRMPKWMPGYNGDEPVNVSYSVPVSFKLISKIDNGDGKSQAMTDPFGDGSATIQNTEKPKEEVESNIISPGIFKKVEQMPYFSGCGSNSNKSREKRNCSNERLSQFISDNVKYPELAQQKKTQGVVYVKFIVDEFGKVKTPEVTRDIGNGCAEEALRVIDLMPLWEPGRQDGKPVKVELRLPVRFYLKDGSEQSLWLSWGNQRGITINEKNIEKLMDDNVLVWDELGNEKHVNALTFVYQKGSKITEATSTGRINSKVQKLLKKVRKGGDLVILALVQQDGELIEVERKFKIIK